MIDNTEEALAVYSACINGKSYSYIYEPLILIIHYVQ